MRKPASRWTATAAVVALIAAAAVLLVTRGSDDGAPEATAPGTSVPATSAAEGDDGRRPATTAGEPAVTSSTTTTTATPPPPTAAPPGEAPALGPAPGPGPPAAPPPATGGPAPAPVTTGVPAGTTLRPYTGRLVVTQDGAVVEGLDVRGCIVVQADDVTIRRTRVRGAPCDNGHQIDVGYGEHHGLVVEDTEIDGLGVDAYAAGIGNDGFTCRRCDIHGVGQGASVGSDVVIESSRIHDLVGDGDSHNAAVVALGGSSRIRISGNVLVCDVERAGRGGGCSAALSLYNAYGPLEDVTVDGNLLNGGSYCLYAGASHGDAPVTGIRITGNRFGRDVHPECGDYGPATAWRPGSGNVWSGNVWADGSGPVGPD